MLYAARNSELRHVPAVANWVMLTRLVITNRFLAVYLVFIVPVAQWLEHCVCSAKVVGSIPREHMY